MTEVYPKCWYCIRISCRHVVTVAKSPAPICIVHVLHTRLWRTVYAMHLRGLACISVRVGAATLGLQQAKDLESMAFDICKLLIIWWRYSLSYTCRDLTWVQWLSNHRSRCWSEHLCCILLPSLAWDVPYLVRDLKIENVEVVEKWIATSLSPRTTRLKVSHIRKIKPKRSYFNVFQQIGPRDPNQTATSTTSTRLSCWQNWCHPNSRTSSAVRNAHLLCERVEHTPGALEYLYYHISSHCVVGFLISLYLICNFRILGTFVAPATIFHQELSVPMNANECC